MKTLRKVVRNLIAATAMALCTWYAPVFGDGPTLLQELAVKANSRTE